MLLSYLQAPPDITFSLHQLCKREGEVLPPPSKGKKEKRKEKDGTPPPSIRKSEEQSAKWMKAPLR